VIPILPDLLEQWTKSPVIAAIKDAEGARDAAASPVGVVFVLGGSLEEIPAVMEILREGRKTVFLHADLIDGLGRSDAAVSYIAHAFRPEGLISTHRPMLRAATREGLLTIQRLFLLDSASLATGVGTISRDRPDIIELVPGVIPKAIRYFRTQTAAPIIAGGMITSREEALAALTAGAAAVSTSERPLWGERWKQS
jgi:glycerol uptake operon antiterminator